MIDPASSTVRLAPRFMQRCRLGRFTPIAMAATTDSARPRAVS
jgi:hypothetical protein